MTPITLTGPRLETERLILRLPQASDFPAFEAFQNGPRAAERGWQMDKPALHDFWHKQFGRWVMLGYGWFVIERRSDAAALGFVGIGAPADAPEPEIGWTIWRDDAVGQGYAFEAARAVLRFAFDTLGLASIPSYITADNTRSAALAQRLGAVRDGTTLSGGQPCDIWRHHPEGAA